MPCPYLFLKETASHPRGFGVVLRAVKPFAFVGTIVGAWRRRASPQFATRRSWKGAASARPSVSVMGD
jgi:hypothetical protein